MLKLLAGLDRPTTGHIYFESLELNALDDTHLSRWRAKHVGFVFQDYQLLSHLTALENVMLPLEIHGDRESRSKAEDFLEKVGLLSRQSHYPWQLSGGEQQRVAIARALVSSPNLLFIDEPIAHLDHKAARQCMDLLFDLNRAQTQKATVFCVSHDRLISNYCDRVLELCEGQLIA